MNQGEFQLVRALFERTLTLGPTERAAELSRAGPPGSPVRDEVESLLREATHAENFLQSAAVPPNAALKLAAAANDAAADPLIGRDIGGYLIERLAGSGGMGRVYQARQINPDRPVAIKVLAAANVSSSSRLRLQHEASLLARLRHPCIAQIYEAGTSADGIAFLAMEFLSGAEPITTFASREGLSTSSRLDLFCRACDAVHHGHQRGVIHRDLKPGNILVEPPTTSDPPIPRVIDFGIARLCEPLNGAASQQTATGQFMGTLAYASPEQCGSDPHDIDTRADVYALGVVLFELLTTMLPIDVNGCSLIEAAARINDSPPRRLGQLRPELRGDLETIVGKALAKDRTSRYASAAHLAADLRRYLANEPIEARPPSVVYQARLFARRHRVAVAAAGAAAAVLVVSAVGGVLLAAHATRQAAAAEAARGVATAQRDRAVRVAEFLQGALGSGNPYLPMRVSDEARLATFEPYADWRMSRWEFAGEPGQAATVTDVLKAAANRLEGAFDDELADRAALGDVLGRSLYNLADAPAAGAALGRAMNDARKSLGLDHEVTIRTTLHYAEYLGRFESATPREELFVEARASAERLYGPFDARTFEVLRQHAYDMFVWQNKPAAGAQLLQNAVDRAQAVGQHRTEAALTATAYSAMLLDWAGEHQRALATGRGALADLQTVTGKDSLATAEAARLLGQIIRRGGKPENAAEAADLLQQSADLFAQHFGAGSQRAVNGYAETALARLAALDAAGAEAPARLAKEGFSRLLGEDRFETRQARATLASVLMNIGGHAAEQRRLADSVSSAVASMPEDVSLYLWTMRLISAQADLALGTPGAHVQMRAIIDEGDSRNAVSDVLRARARVELASFLLSQGNDRDATVLLNEARGLLDAAGPGPSHTRRVFDAVSHQAAQRASTSDPAQLQPSK